MGRAVTKINETKRIKVVNKAYHILMKALEKPDSDVTPAEKRRIALEVVKKTTPKTVDLGKNTTDTFASMMKAFWVKRQST